MKNNIYNTNGTLIAWYLNVLNFEQSGLTFFSHSADFLQVGIWNHPVDSVLTSHIHNVHQKPSNRTTESIFILSGSVHADIFDEDEILISSLKLSSGDLLTCLAGGHGFKILEKNTKVLEFKNGPYLGIEIDRRRFLNTCKICLEKTEEN